MAVSIAAAKQPAHGSSTADPAASGSVAVASAKTIAAATTCNRAGSRHQVRSSRMTTVCTGPRSLRRWRRGRPDHLSDRLRPLQHEAVPPQQGDQQQDQASDPACGLQRGRGERTHSISALRISSW